MRCFLWPWLARVGEMGVVMVVVVVLVVGGRGVHRLLQTHQFSQGNFEITLIMVEKLPNLLRRVFAPDAT